MRKTIYYRAIAHRPGGEMFRSDIGYLTTFYNGFGSVDLVFGKNSFGRWSITEYETGLLVHNETFQTRREAVAAITPEYLKLILDKLYSPLCEKARENLRAYRASL